MQMVYSFHSLLKLSTITAFAAVSHSSLQTILTDTKKLSCWEIIPWRTFCVIYLTLEVKKKKRIEHLLFRLQGLGLVGFSEEIRAWFGTKTPFSGLEGRALPPASFKSRLLSKLAALKEVTHSMQKRGEKSISSLSPAAFSTGGMRTAL